MRLAFLLAALGLASANADNVNGITQDSPSSKNELELFLDSLDDVGGDVHALANKKNKRDKRIYEEYVCDPGKNGKKLLDAMKLSCPSDNCKSECCCNQICLPKGVWKIAQKHGVTKGNCSAMGWTDFEWQGVRSGVHYNVYSNPNNMTTSG